PVHELEPRSSAQPRCVSVQETDRPRTGYSHASGERTDRNIKGREVRVKEGALRAEKEGGREERAGPRALTAEHRQPEGEQGGEKEPGQSPGLRVGQEVERAREGEMRAREE